MIMNGKELASKIKTKLLEEVAKMEQKPGLVVIQVGSDPASSIYVKSKAKLATEIGFHFEHLTFPDDVTEAELIAKIEELNENDKIDGMIVQLPIPAHLDSMKIINKIKPEKDIDGLTKLNAGSLLTANTGLVSCTPKGIMTLLAEYKVELEGKHVVIVGRSNLVGKPLISLCLEKNATVTICHSRTKDLTRFTKEADVLIVAVGKKDLIDGSMVKEGAIVVDVGINRVDNHIYGDVNFETVAPVASLITPVPGGVGPMTTISLMENVLLSHNMMKKGK